MVHALVLVVTINTNNMKKAFLFLMSMFIVIASHAQSNSEHLTFKGVPIDGTLSEYVAKMQSAGFKYWGEDDGVAILKGDFAGIKGCTIGVATLKSTNKVNTIAVIFPEQDDWVSLENRYEHLKSMLTEKYGEPSECVEKFQGYSNPKTDNDKLHRVLGDECTWYTLYRTPKGSIELSVDNESLFKCFVILRYFDKINTDAVRAQAMEDL